MTLRFKLLALAALAATLTAAPGCAVALVNAEGALVRTIAITQDTADAVCDAGLADAPSCRQFNIRLIPVIGAAKEFNKAVQENSYAEIPAMMSAVLALRDSVVEFFQDESLRKQLQARIEGVYQLVALMRGK